MKLIILIAITLLSANVAMGTTDDWNEYMKAVEQEASTSDVTSKATFSCTIIPKSSPKPTSVHKLTPGDIDIISAIGDSLTAANGAKASTILGLTDECRGVSWAMGGESSVNTVSTLPNILRQYNPSLYGFSTGTGKVGTAVSFLNYAEPGHTSHNTLQQAINLVNKMKSDPKVDMDNHWKLVNVFIGGNDLCKFCTDRGNYTAARYLSNLKSTLQYFKANLKRTFVSLVISLDVTGIDILTGVTCRNMQKSLCNCAIDQQYRTDLNAMTKAILEGTEPLLLSGEFDDRDDFTVVAQPFMRGMTPPLLGSGAPDYTYFAPDCFHFSTKGHSAAGVELWNNIVSPVGQKSEKWETLGAQIKCPTATSPYLHTYKNKP
jgi:phospholipase B1